VTATITELPADYESAIAAAVDRVFADKGLSFDIEPRYWSPSPVGVDISAAIRGAELMGLPLTPQGIQTARVLEARSDELDPVSGLYRPLFEECAVQEPRRSTKTTIIQMILLGRCAKIPGYRVVSTAQDGTRASQFFMNMVRMVEATMRRSGLTEADLGIRQIYRSQGREYIEFENGSRWWVVKPESGAFRGEAADCMWFDEAGELDATKSEDLVAGAFPLMDTRPLGQIIISGTPAMARAGMFWDALERARKEPEAYGIVDYCAEDTADITDEAVWWKVHPGLASGLTTIVKLRRNFTKLGAVQFAREYLCIWPPDSLVTALDLKKWAATAVDAFDGPPEELPWGIGFDVDRGGTVAAVAVAWLDAFDAPHVQIVDHRAGSQWVIAYLARAIRKHPRTPVGYDSIGENLNTAHALERMGNLPTKHVRALNLRDVAAATALFSQSNESMTIQHAKHGGLDTAVENATWRDAGGSRLFQRGKGVEITCLLACVHALGAVATEKRRAPVSIPSPM
jgi:hypothetical protein